MPYPDDFNSARYDATIGGERDEDAIADLAAKHIKINEAIRAIMLNAIAEIEKLDLTGYSMADGYDLDQIPDLIREVMPIIGKDDVVALEELAEGELS